MPVFAGGFGRLNGFPVDEDFPGVGRLEPDEMFEQHAFAAAARAHDDENFAGLDREIDAFEHLLPVKTFAQAAHLEADAGMLVGCGVHSFRSAPASARSQKSRSGRWN